MTKMTMFIDEALLERVMKLTGLKTKTEAVEFALGEAERHGKLSKFLAEERRGAIDWKDALDPAYDLMALRMAEMPFSPKKNKRGSR
ncbi:MAG TPA: type II toxin-antitoxin system VapB family antitoxin [Chthoniobacterales bacterium]|jgi:Arc/MetJ family transcription regulator|nr:type II toxin-antitoxin system VapB family antitoxin [Chthoniobacterales bacterium]